MSQSGNNNYDWSQHMYSYYGQEDVQFNSTVVPEASASSSSFNHNLDPLVNEAASFALHQNYFDPFPVMTGASSNQNFDPRMTTGASSSSFNQNFDPLSPLMTGASSSSTLNQTFDPLSFLLIGASSSSSSRKRIRSSTSSLDPMSVVATTTKVQPPKSAFTFFTEHRATEQSIVSPQAMDMGDDRFLQDSEELWRDLGDDFKAFFHDMAIDDQSRYDAEMYNQSQLPPIPTTVSQLPTNQNGRVSSSKTKIKKQHDAPKGPSSAFNHFGVEQRPIIKSENPQMKFVDITKELGRRWSLMNINARQKYKSLADQDKARYAQEMANYNPPPPTPSNNWYNYPFNYADPSQSSSSGIFPPMNNLNSSDIDFWLPSLGAASFPTGLNQLLDPFGPPVPDDDDDVQFIDSTIPEDTNSEPLISPYDIAFAKFQFLTSAPVSHKFNGISFQARNEHEFLQAYQREIKILEELPNGIFVVGYENRMDLFSALIIGPEGTPYEGGLFAFDIMLPSTFPHVPPIFHFISYAHDRMNPNLYVQGKVCVSILGTWEGQSPVEKWSAKDSSLLQVLVSIQGLILVAEPYFNEPGFANSQGTNMARTGSRRYNERVIHLMLESVTGMLAKPPPPFEFEVMYVLKNEVPRMISRIESWCNKKTRPKFPMVPLGNGTPYSIGIENLKKAHAKYVKM